MGRLTPPPSALPRGWHRGSTSLLAVRPLPQRPGHRHTVRAVPDTAGTSGTDLYLERDKVHPVFANCLTEDRANLPGVTQRPAATTAFSETAKAAAWKEIPSWALVGRQDMTISPQQERFQAGRAHSHTQEMDSCHVSLIARPDAVADLILQAATAAPANATGSAPRLADSGIGGRGERVTVLGALAATCLTAGAAALCLGRRLRRTPRRVPCGCPPTK
ncbi:alpha/beta hydrolase [Streptomyces sp. NPDC046831]|uniref:alpha/beta hydrolase n=1 Tax=Streptomyces sp. NPDC046831 TaxID=3154805 RepID=UPI0033C2FF74